MEKIIIALLASILLIGVSGIIFFYRQSKKNKADPSAINIELLQKDIEHSKETLKNQVDILAGQLNDFKNSWTGSDNEKGAKLVSLITNIDKFQETLTQRDVDYKRNADVIRTQVTDVIKDLAKLQESSNVLGKINDNVQSLQEVFVNTKKRGNVGEYLLEKILTNMLGSNPKLWERQYQTNDGKIVDAYVKTSEEKEGIAIDSKFSTDNYKKYLESEDAKIKAEHLKVFRTDIRKRIDEVAKYINIKNKISSAVMFIPSEEIFAFIYANFSDDIIDYAFKKRVWITSPTTLAAVLFTVEKNIKDIEFNKNLEKISKKLILFKVDFDRWVDRWEEVKKGFQKTNESVNKLDTSHNKIAGHYRSILEMSEESTESE